MLWEADAALLRARELDPGAGEPSAAQGTAAQLDLQRSRLEELASSCRRSLAEVDAAAWGGQSGDAFRAELLACAGEVEVCAGEQERAAQVLRGYAAEHQDIRWQAGPLKDHLESLAGRLEGVRWSSACNGGLHLPDQANAA